MALNFSRRSILPSRMLEDVLVSPIRLSNGRIVNEGVVENTRLNGGGDDYFTCSSEGNSCQNSDVFDFLPVDPFGMDISSTVTAITWWLEDLDINNVGYVGDVGGGMDGSNYPFFAGLNLLWNNAMAMKFQPYTGLELDYDFFNSYSSPNYVYPNVVGMRNWSDNIGSCSETGISACAADFSEENDASSFVDRLGVESVDKGFYDCIDSKNFSSSVDLGSRSVSRNIRFDDSARYGKQSDAIDVLAAVNDYIPDSCCEKRGNSSTKVNNCFKDSHGSCFSGSGGSSHYALYSALGYLDLRDLLAVDRVCKPLHSAVRMENLLWRSLRIHQPLNEKITDEVLLHLTDRAQGKLECLSLVECPRITDDGLRRVLDKNPELSKLSVPGCTRLSINSLLGSLRTLKLLGTLQLKHVRIGGIYGMTGEQFDELKLLLGVEAENQLEDRKPHFYRRANLYLACEDDRVLDIEICPMCQKARLVYDCPYESCMMKPVGSPECRACTLCIARCVECGRCINDTEYEETFCLDFVCSTCSTQPSLKDPVRPPACACAAMVMDDQIDGIACRG